MWVSCTRAYYIANVWLPCEILGVDISFGGLRGLAGMIGCGKYNEWVFVRLGNCVEWYRVIIVEIELYIVAVSSALHMGQ